jgi:hypothetical protein
MHGNMSCLAPFPLIPDILTNNLPLLFLKALRDHLMFRILPLSCVSSENMSYSRMIFSPVPF